MRSLRLFQITIEVNTRSVGRIAEQIGLRALSGGWESFITYSRYCGESRSEVIKTDSKLSIYGHAVMTRLFDRHCLHSTGATRRLVERIKEVDPDIIHLHNIHGYYIDMRVLFDYLSTAGKPVVWTLHDSWAFTGHCTNVRHGGGVCDRWLSHCNRCPQKGAYPASWFADRSYENFELKKRLFNSVSNLTLVPVSEWLLSMAGRSFLGGKNMVCIHNGIDIERFCRRDNRDEICRKFGIDAGKPYVLGVASVWSASKGLDDFVLLRRLLPDDVQIVLAGLDKRAISRLPEGIIGLGKTDSADVLAGLYSGAEVFVNPTHNDSFPTVNIEAQSCGTAVVTYDADGAPETICDGSTGVVVRCGDVDALAAAVERLLQLPDDEKTALSQRCRARAVAEFDYRLNFEKYIELYDTLIGKR